MYYKFIYVIILFISYEVGTYCPLLWNSKQTLGYENGIQLQVCCNVTSAKIWHLLSGTKWSLGAKVLEENVNKLNDDTWSELQLTSCDDKIEPTIGYIEARNGTKCKHYRGQTFNIPPRKVSLDAWYLICYETIQNCLQCHIEVLCKNDFSSECASIWMQSSVRAITNTTMIIWMSIGYHYPFQHFTTLYVTITDQVHGKHLGIFTKENFNTSYMELHIQNLLPNTLYLVEACTHITPPNHFLESYYLKESLNKYSRQMCQRGLYRTKAAQWPIMNNVTLLMMVLYFSLSMVVQ